MYTTPENLKLFITNNHLRSFSFGDKITKINTSRVSDTDFLFRFKDIEINETLSGNNSFLFVFTAVDTYKIYHTLGTEFSNLFIGEFSVLDEEEIPDLFTIPENTFENYFEDDHLEFEINSGSSILQIRNTIIDAQIEIDVHTERRKIIKWGPDYLREDQDIEDFLDENEELSPFLFENPPFDSVPLPITLATNQFAFAFILERKLVPFSSEDLTDGFARTLKNSARLKVDKFLDNWRQLYPDLTYNPVREKYKDKGNLASLALNNPMLNPMNRMRRELYLGWWGAK